MEIMTVTIVVRKVNPMRKPRKRSFSELVLENKRQLLQDQEALEKIEERLEKKRLGQAR